MDLLPGLPERLLQHLRLPMQLAFTLLKPARIVPLLRGLASLPAAAPAMGLPLHRVVAALEAFAPKRLAASWDNVGLLIEPTQDRTVNHVLLTNDLTESVMCEAVDLGVEMIVCYHPPVFAPLKSVTRRTWKERLVATCLENRIALYSPHTAWDAVDGGVNCWLSSSFQHMSMEAIEKTEEAVAHGSLCGMGRLLQLQAPITISDAVEAVKAHLGMSHVRLALAAGTGLDAKVHTVAVCAGSGASVLKLVKADLLLTGEMLHHDILDASCRGTHVLLTNHSDSERGFLTAFRDRLANKMLEGLVSVTVSSKDSDPLHTV